MMPTEREEKKEKEKKNCPLMATKLPCVKPPFWDSPYLTLAACVDPDGASRSCSSGAAVEAVRVSGLLVIL